MIYATFTDDGDPTGFYSSEIHRPRTRPLFGPMPAPTEEDPAPSAPIIGEEPNPDTVIPADAIEITFEQWQEFIDNNGRRRWQNGAVVPYDPPPAPAPAFTRVPKADIWRRLTEPEAETLDAALQAAPIRLRRIFEAAQYLDTADEDYPALRAGIVAALGETRADEILAPTY